MEVWLAVFSGVIGALAYGGIACALLRLFQAPHAAILGRLRWLILGLLAVAAAAQAGLGLRAGLGLTGGGDALALLASLCLLALAVSLWPVLYVLRSRLVRAIGRRARLRLAQADQEAGEALAWLELAAAAAQFGHWRINLADRTLEWSDAMYRIHGLSPETFVPALEPVMALFHPEDRKAVSGGIAGGMAEGGRFEVKARLCRPDGALRHVILCGRAQGAATVVGVLVDVTEQKVAEARLREANQVALRANAALKDMTLEDEVTGIANRRQFDLSLVHEFRRAVRSTQPLGLVLVELDHFQTYLEHYGQEAGDACLRRVAQAIKAVPRRTGDLVARYGHDGMAVLLPLADVNGAARVATLMREAVQSLRIPCVGSGAGYVTISCGATAFIGVHELNNPLELVRRADQALYQAKAAGRDQVARFVCEAGGDLRDVYGPCAAQDRERFIKSRA